MLRQGAQHAPLLCPEACWLAPSTMPWMHCSTPCWLVQYCQGADWRAACASPRVARVAREARLSVNPAAHARRGSCSTGDFIANAVAVTPTFPLPIKSARPLALLFSRRNLACCFFFIGVCNFQAAYSCIIVE